MGTVCACGDGCALLVPFMGTAQACGGGCALVRLRQTQTSHIHKKNARITSSLIRTLFSIIF